MAVLMTVPAASAIDYVIGPDDVIRISIYGHADLAVTERVSGEGMVTFPFLGTVKIAGLTVDQAEYLLASRLSDGYIVDPQVSVYIVEFKSRKAVMIGQVQRPGVYQLTGRTTFLELLSTAGGLGSDAGDRAIIKRKGSGALAKETTITIDLKKLIEEGDSSLDVTLSDSDNIYIPKAGVFYITGEVRKADAYRHEEGITVMKAITKAGGFSDRASKSRIKIIRKLESKEKVLEKVMPDELVYPDDIIIVPESLF